MIRYIRCSEIVLLLPKDFAVQKYKKAATTLSLLAGKAS